MALGRRSRWNAIASSLRSRAESGVELHQTGRRHNRGVTLKPTTFLRRSTMPKFIIEREIPNAGALSATDLTAIAQKSCSVLRELGAEIQWVQSYVTEDKITCVYIASNAELIREHARRGGFPADRVLEIATVIDPTTAEGNRLAEVDAA